MDVSQKRKEYEVREEKRGAWRFRETSVAKAEGFESQHLETFIQFDRTAM